MEIFSYLCTKFNEILYANGLIKEKRHKEKCPLTILFSQISQIEESYKSKEDAHVRVGTLLVQSSLGVWEMPRKRRRSDCPRFLY